MRHRSNGMTDKVTFSYWDYARRFLAWRIDDYRRRRRAQAQRQRA